MGYLLYILFILISRVVLRACAKRHLFYVKYFFPKYDDLSMLSD